ncbi:MAG: YybH family protein [Sphingomicrobium sp.]
MPNLRTAGVLLGAALIVSVSACQRQEAREHHNGASVFDLGATKDAITADEKAWNEQFDAKDVDALVARYASDAHFVVPGMKGISGTADIRKAYEEAFKDPAFAVDFSSDKIDASGDLAYSRGHFTEKFTDPKTKQVATHSGSYVTIYKKDPDGGWKVVDDFTAVEPADGAAPAAQ